MMVPFKELGDHKTTTPLIITILSMTTTSSTQHQQQWHDTYYYKTNNKRDRNNSNNQSKSDDDIILHILLEKNGINDINIQDKYGNTALHYSCQYNLFHIIKILLKNGANPNIQNMLGQTCLHRGIIKITSNNSNNQNYNNNANTNYKNKAYNNNNIDNDIIVINLLLQNNATNVTICDIDGNTPLHLLIHNNKFCYNINLIKLLLQHGADPMISNKKGITCYHLCCLYQSLIITKLLLTSSSFHNSTNHYLNITDTNGNTPFHYAIGCNSLGQHNYSTHEMNIPFIQFLLHNGANPNTQNKWGRTILHYICQNNSQNSNVVALIKLLFQYNNYHHVNINVQDKDGNTPLYYIIQQIGSIPDDNVTTRYMRITPPPMNNNNQQLQLQQPHMNIFLLLLYDYNADYTIRNKYGKNAIDIAKGDNHYRYHFNHNNNSYSNSIIECIEKLMEHRRIQSYQFILHHWIENDD